MKVNPSRTENSVIISIRKYEKYLFLHRIQRIDLWLTETFHLYLLQAI